jgi:predicted membrane channel-forming protein YqfA (hemolysin III family)
MDYIGIVFLIVGSFIPSIFYGFYCHPILQILYITMVCPHFSSISSILERENLHIFAR